MTHKSKITSDIKVKTGSQLIPTVQTLGNPLTCEEDEVSLKASTDKCYDYVWVA